MSAPLYSAAWVASNLCPTNEITVYTNLQRVYSGTQAEYDAAPPAGPAIWILTDSVPPLQVIAIP